MSKVKLPLALALDGEGFKEVTGRVEKSRVLINTSGFFNAQCSAWLKVRPFVSIIKYRFMTCCFSWK